MYTALNGPVLNWTRPASVKAWNKYSGFGLIIHNKNFNPLKSGKGSLDVNKHPHHHVVLGKMIKSNTEKNEQFVKLNFLIWFI